MAWDRGHCIPFPIPDLPPKFELGGSWIRFWNWVCKVPDVVAVYSPCKLKYVTYSIVKNVLNWLRTLLSITYGFHWTQYHRHMYVAESINQLLLVDSATYMLIKIYSPVVTV